MRLLSVVFGLLLLAPVAAQAPTPRVSSRQPAKRPSRPDGSLAQVMRGIMFPNANIIFDVQTNDPGNPGGTGNALASFLLNVPNSAGRRNVHETTRWGGVMGFYFHDQWKATPKLTVNLGLRYDRTFIPPYGREDTVGVNGGIETGDLDLLNGVYILQRVPPTCAERGYSPCIPDPSGKLPEHVIVDPRGKIYHDTTKNFQPRFGLAYRLTPNTALRGSFG